MSPTDLNVAQKDYLDDPQRRVYLIRLLVGGALLPFAGAEAAWFGKARRKLDKEKSIFKLRGKVWVNGRAADENTRIHAGDTVKTGRKSGVVFAVGGDSFILRANGEIEIDGADFFIDQLRILSGRLLSVFAKRDSGQRVNMTASTATIGIRGSGVYAEVDPDKTYLCTCYGKVDLRSSVDPSETEEIITTNHDKPRYIYAEPRDGSRIQPAKVINHSNTELQLLETLVGRKAPKHIREGGGYEK